MLGVVLGITYGLIIGLFNNFILHFSTKLAKARGLEPIQVMGRVFFVRYMVDLVSLMLPGFLLKGTAIHLGFMISAALSLAILGNIALLIIYHKKGGRFE